ncbi:MAG: hypothetical protein MJK04_30220 [Psychrosphaera sp.]|nr:hypothetical protein [Psychrosphaera sp.]
MKVVNLLSMLFGSFIIPSVAAFETIQYPEVQQICMKKLPASLPKCKALIKALESKNSAGDLLRLAAAYINLSFKLPDKMLREHWRKKVTATYHRVLEIEPNNVRALNGTSIYLPTSEQIIIWRRILTIDPTYAFVWKTLSIVLLKGSDRERKEGLQVLRKGYAQFEGKQGWHLGISLYEALYKESEKFAKAQLRSEILRDMGVNEHPQFYDIAIKQLAQSCDPLVFRLDGEAICLHSIRLVVDANAPSKARLKQDSTKLLSALKHLLPSKHQLQKQFPDIQIELRDLLEDIKLTGDQPLEFYLVYALLLTGERRIAALQQASALTTGKPGKAASWLADTLVKQGRYDEAIILYQKLVKNGVYPYSSTAETALRMTLQLTDKQ